MTTPSKTEQQQEALQRARERGHGAPDNVQPPVDDNTTPAELPADTSPPPEVVAQDEPAGKPKRFTDPKRNAIVARFRENRSTEADEDAAEILAFAHHGIPPELVSRPRAVEPEPEPDPVVEDTPPADAPVKRTKVIVRGREMELSDEELLAHAQKSLAADDYLGEAKGKLDEVNQLLRDTRTRAAPGPTPHTPAPQAGERTDQPTDTPVEHPARKPMSKVVELLQFGDPEEAAAELDRSIDERAAQRSSQALQRERLRNETTRSHRFLQEFATEHPDLAQDSYASAAMEKRLFELQREDLVKLAKSFGKDESVVPTSPAAIAQWHLYYRTEGHPVRDVPNLLKQTRDDFVSWRDKGKPAKEEPAPKPAAPRVEVVVDRSARRATIPQQPSRTVTPKPDAAVTPPAPRDRSAIVAQMQRQRAKNRGVVLGT
jgi:hypothetical protein